MFEGLKAAIGRVFGGAGVEPVEKKSWTCRSCFWAGPGEEFKPVMDTADARQHVPHCPICRSDEIEPTEGAEKQGHVWPRGTSPAGEQAEVIFDQRDGTSLFDGPGLGIGDIPGVVAGDPRPLFREALRQAGGGERSSGLTGAAGGRGRSFLRGLVRRR